MSIPILCADPAKADPIAKRVMHERRTGFRPKIDTRPPHRGMSAVAAKGYALPAQMKLAPCRSCTIVGSVVDIAPYTTSSSGTSGNGKDVLAKSKADRKSQVKVATSNIQKLSPTVDHDQGGDVLSTVAVAGTSCSGFGTSEPLVEDISGPDARFWEAMGRDGWTRQFNTAVYLKRSVRITRTLVYERAVDCPKQNGNEYRPRTSCAD